MKKIKNENRKGHVSIAPAANTTAALTGLTKPECYQRIMYNIGALVIK